MKIAPKEITSSFVVTFDKKTTLTKDQVIKLFKLQTSVTENFTCMDENNKIFEAETPFDILKRYVDIKLAYIEKRKSSDLGKSQNQNE